MLVVFHSDTIKTTLYEILSRMKCESHEIKSLRDLLNVVRSSGLLDKGFAEPRDSGRISSNEPSVTLQRARRTSPGGNVPLVDYLHTDSKQLTLDEIEEIFIYNALHRYHWNCKTTAKQLGIDRATLYRKMKKYGITREK